MGKRFHHACAVDADGKTSVLPEDQEPAGRDRGADHAHHYQGRRRSGQEASWLAAWLHDRLVAQFGEARVFLDIDWIKPGVDFMQVITEAIARSRVLLVIIGPQWLAGDVTVLAFRRVVALTSVDLGRLLGDHDHLLQPPISPRQATRKDAASCGSAARARSGWCLEPAKVDPVGVRTGVSPRAQCPRRSSASTSTSGRPVQARRNADAQPSPPSRPRAAARAPATPAAAEQIREGRPAHRPTRWRAGNR